MKLFTKTIFGAGLGALSLVLALAAQASVYPGNLPLWFEAGHGENETETQFTAHGRNAEFAITRSGAEFTLHRANGQPATAHMTFAGASLGSELKGDHALGGKINYLLGNDPAQWLSGLPTYGKVRLDNIYPGINVVYYGNQQQLEYDFDLAAGVNPETIAIRFEGAEKISINPAGDLVIQLDGGQIIQHQPVAYQVMAGLRHEVNAGYAIVDAHTVTFAVGNFDHSQPLVIDPVLGYSTFFGGNNGEIAWAIAINQTDNSIFIAGQTFSTVVSNGPPLLPFATIGAYATTNKGGGQVGDAFVAKFDRTGNNLIYCTYLGGSGNDTIHGIAVNGLGNAFVTGVTDSTNFPTANAVVNTFNGTFDGSHITGVKDVNIGSFPYDAFVAELDPSGTGLVYSTYLGGNEFEAAFAIAIDPADDAFVTGYTSSTNFPITSDAYHNRLYCSNNIYANENAFVAEIAPGGNKLNYSTYFGGTNFDVGLAIAYTNNMVFVAGSTASTNFPWINGLVSSKNLNGFTNATPGSDAFVTMFTSNTVTGGLSLQYSTFLGSSNNDVATGIAADAAGNAYVVGWTTSTNFPNTTNVGTVQLDSVVRTNSTGFVFATNAFITKIAYSGGVASNAYSQIFGGAGVDVANGVTLDMAGNIFIVGSASSRTNFPVTRDTVFGSLRNTNSSVFGSSDVFVTAIKADLSTLLYSAYLGGRQDDFGNGIAVDSDGNAWVTGQTISTNYPVLGNGSPNSPALHSIRVGTNDVFLTKILTSSAGDPVLYAQQSGTNVLVFWPAVADVTPVTLGLETATNLVGTTNWVVVTNPVPVLLNSNYTYIFVSPTNAMKFYRFHHF